ncbi:MAG: DUF6194 family protein [Planctomycetes bacterium]|nr:DUF6194 family protein [Planctomycetota bacterium]
MNEAAITKHIAESFEGVDVVTASGGTFFFYDPEKKFTFATLSINDEYDQFSDLNRPGVFRLNVGISKQTFQSMFKPTDSHDFTVLDRIMPHPVYGKMYWICVLSPSETTFETLKPLIAEAYAIDKAKRDRRASSQG